MDLNDILKHHQLWLDNAHKTLTSKGGNQTDVDLGPSRADRLKARIAELTRQKQREIDRYDAAIKPLIDELAGLGAGAASGKDSSAPKKKKTRQRK